MALWSDLDNVSEFYNSMHGHVPPEQPRKVIVSRSPLLKLDHVAYDEDDIPDDLETDSTLILDMDQRGAWNREIANLPGDDDEEIPFMDDLGDDDEQ